MKTNLSTYPAKSFATLLLLVAALLITPPQAQAHCDTMNGPVVLDAKRALETGTVEPVLKWVTLEDEADVRAAFARTMNVRDTSADVRELADLYFFETVVRLHRMSEGVGYTGLKPATTVDPAIAAADEALETGSVEAFANLLVHELHEALTGRFAEAYQARQHAEYNVEAGRAYVQAYVRFTHLAEAIAAVTKHANEARPDGHTAGHDAAHMSGSH